MLIQLYTLQTSWCEYWWVFARNGLVLRGSYTSWLQVGGQTRTRDVYTLDSGLWRTAGPPTRALGRTRAELSGDPPGAGGRTGRNAEGRRRGGRLVRLAHAQTTRTRARSRLSSEGPGWPPRSPLSIRVQWAAKVAFFKLKLDQLMDSLCRVCLAESKQNLEDKKPHSHGGDGNASATGGGGGTVPLGTPASASDTPVFPCPFPLGPQGECPAWPGSATAPSLLSLARESQGREVKQDSAPPPPPSGQPVQSGTPRPRLLCTGSPVPRQ